MDCLTQPSIPAYFKEDILSALLDHGTNLALVYYHTVSPSLSEPDLLLKFFTKLSQASITEAYYFSQHEMTSHRRALLEIIIDTAIAGKGPSRAARAVELVDLPLDADEEQWLEEYLLTGSKSRNVRGAADIIVMRKMAKGKLQESTEEMQNSKVSRVSINDVTWGNVKNGLERGMGPRDADDIYDTE
jgi:hypothetical protein